MFTGTDVLPSEGSLEFIVTAGHIDLGTHLRVVVDPADAILECDELDQEHTELIEGCP